MQLNRNKEMEFEILKKSHKKQIVIGALAICVIGGALTFTTSRARYKLTQDLELAKGTINYKPCDFKVMAMYQSEDGTNYTEINDMPSSGYIINEEKTYCTTDNKTQVKGKIKTENRKHYISGLSKSDKCYLYFDKEKSEGEKVLDNLNITVKTGTPTTFAAGATTNEGVYSVADGVYGGTSYYWRGLVTSNYVKFANFCWRIVRINGDGSIRLIYDGTTCHANGSNSDSIAKTSIAYNTSADNSSYVGWTYTASSQRPSGSGTASNAKTQLESWYNSNITGTNASKVVAGKYCNDRNVRSGDTWSATGSTFYYAAYKRIYADRNPSLACNSSDVYTLNVGLITVDEAMYAGGTNANNTSYYLYNGQSYWTMSPLQWNGSSSSVNVFIVNTNGTLGSRNTNYTHGLRPVINLKSDVTFSSGDGTQNNPYIVQ